MLIAWLLDPLVTKMEKKMNRVLACIITYLLLIILVVVLCYFVIPSFATGVTDLVNALPSLIDKTKKGVDNFFASLVLTVRCHTLVFAIVLLVFHSFLYHN